MTRGTDFPSPWVVGLTPHRGDLIVTVTMFGFATEWLAAAVELLGQAIACRVDWAGRTGLFVPKVEIKRRRLLGIDGAAVSRALYPPIQLDFRSPLVSSGAGAEVDPAAPFTTLGLRLEGIARWHGATLGKTDWHRVATALKRLEWTWLVAEPVVWRRGSRRQGALIPMRGTIGRLLVEGDAADLDIVGPLLHLGSEVHVGADIAFGCGRYVILADQRR